MNVQPRYRNSRGVESTTLQVVHDASRKGEVIYCDNGDGRGFGPAFKVRTAKSLALVFTR